MSVRILSDKHINTILSWVSTHNGTVEIRAGEQDFSSLNKRDLQAMATILRETNVQAWNERYDENITITDEAIQFRHTDDVPVVQIIKACYCYDYQCEEVENYKNTPAAQIVEFCRTLAISKLRGYEESAWEIE